MAACADNLRILGLAIAQYAEHSNKVMPSAFSNTFAQIAGKALRHLAATRVFNANKQNFFHFLRAGNGIRRRSAFTAPPIQSFG